MTAYQDYKPLTFHDAVPRFRDGADSKWDVCALSVVHIPESERKP